MSNKVMLYPVTTDGQVKMSGGKSLKDSLGSAGGIATLDANGKLNASQIPNSISGTNASFKRYLSTSTTINNPDTHGIYLIPAPSDLRAPLSYNTNDELNLSFGSYVWNLYAPTSDEEVFFTNDFDIEAPATIIVRNVAGVQTYFAQVNGEAVDFLQYLSTLLTTNNGYPTFVHLDSVERQISTPNEELHLYLQFPQTNWEVYIFILNALKCIYSTNTETIAATLSNLQQLLENIGSFGFSTSIVDVLPTENISTSTIYLKRKILKADAYLAYNGTVMLLPITGSDSFLGIQLVSDITNVLNPLSDVYYIVDSGSAFELYVVDPTTGELALQSALGFLDIVVVQSDSELDPNVPNQTVYFLIKETEDYYKEYLYVDQRWEMIGSTQLLATLNISWIRASNVSPGYVANSETTSWPGSAVDTLVNVNFAEAPRPIAYEYDQEDWVPSSNHSLNAYVYEVSNDVLNYRSDSNIVLLYDGKLYSTIEGTLVELSGISSTQASYTKTPDLLWLDATPTAYNGYSTVTFPQFINSDIENKELQLTDDIGAVDDRVDDLADRIGEAETGISDVRDYVDERIDDPYAQAISLTTSQLLEKIDHQDLQPWQQYRITDYIVNYVVSRSPSQLSEPTYPNPGFDLIVIGDTSTSIKSKVIAVPKETNPIIADCTSWDISVELLQFNPSYGGHGPISPHYSALPSGLSRQPKYCFESSTDTLLFVFEDGLEESAGPINAADDNFLDIFENYKYVKATYYVTENQRAGYPLTTQAVASITLSYDRALVITHLRDEFGNSAFYDFKSPTTSKAVPSGSIVYNDQIFALTSSSWKGLDQYPFNGPAASNWIWVVSTVYECVNQQAYIVKTNQDRYFYLLNPTVTDGYMSIFPGTVDIAQSSSTSDHEVQSSDLTFTSEAQTFYAYTFTSPNRTDLSLTGKVSNVTIDENSQDIVFEAELLRNIKVTNSSHCTLKGATIENLWVDEATNLTGDVTGTTPRMIPDDVVHESDLGDLSADVDTMPWRDSGHSLGYEIDTIEDLVEQVASDIEDVTSDIKTINSLLEETLPVFYDADTYLIPILTYYTTSDGTQKTEFISIDTTGWDVDSYQMNFMEFGSVGGWNIGSDVDMDVDGVYFTYQHSAVLGGYYFFLKEVSNHSIVTEWSIDNNLSSSELAAYVANITSIKVSLYRSTPPDGLYIMAYGEIGYWNGTTTTDITRSIEIPRSYPYFDGPDELRDFFKPIDSSEPFALVDHGEFFLYRNATYDDSDLVHADLEALLADGFTTGWYWVSKNKETHVYLYTNGKAINLLEQSSSSGATATTVDSALSTTSENPVQNKVIKAALDGKVDAVTGKVLSTNDFTDSYKTKLDGLDTALNNKVTVVSGKGLSTEDYTTAELTKLANIEVNANNYTLPAATTLALGGVKIGTNLAVDANGVISGNYSNATTSAAGLMSADDKTKLGGIATGALVNTIETIQVNGTALTPDANKVVNIVISGSGESSGSGTVSTPVNAVEPVTTFPSAGAENIGRVILYVGSDSRFYGETFICTVDTLEPDDSLTYLRIYFSDSGDSRSLSTIYTNSGIPCYKALYYENNSGELIYHLDDGNEITFGSGSGSELTYWRNINDRAVDGQNDVSSDPSGTIYITDITDGTDAMYNSISDLGFRNELDLMVKGVTILFTASSAFTVFLPHEYTHDDGEEITVYTPAHPARIVGAETLECQADCEYLLTIKARNGINFFEMKKLTTPTEVTNNIEVGE